MAQTRGPVIIPESPNPYNHPHVVPPWHYHEGIRSSHSRTSATSTHSHTRNIPVCPSPRRTRTTGGTADHYTHYQHNSPHNHHYPHHSKRPREGVGREPWQHMAQTYTWVAEQEIAEMTRQNEETVRWIMEQQERDVRERTVYAMLGLENKYRHMMEQLVDDFEDMAEQLKAREEQSRRKAMRWQREMEKSAYDEMRRQQQARRQEAERYRMAYERRKAQEAVKEKQRRDEDRQRAKAARDEAEREAWLRYEEQWATLSPTAEPSTTPLTFRTIPWPLVSLPSRVEDISPARVTMFLLSPNHSEGQARKERIKNALRRWHPDRFGRILANVVEDDKKAVEDGVGVIVRCLNNLMERESKMIAQSARESLFQMSSGDRSNDQGVRTENH